MSRREKQHKGRGRSRSYTRWILLAGLVAAAGVGALWAMRSGGGAAATVEPISRLGTRDFHSLAFAPGDPNTVYFGHHGGLLVSRDGGRDWLPTSLENADAMALAAPPADPQLMYAAGHNVFYKSEDGGRTWRQAPNDLPGLDIHGFAADPEQPDLVYAHVVGFGLFRSEDGGETWELRSSSLRALNLTVGETSESLYATAAQSGLLHSTDGGRTWSDFPTLPGEGAVAVAFDRSTGWLYVTTFGRDAGLYRWSQQQESWQSLGLEATLLALAVSPDDPRRLIAVDDEGWVYASRDGGETWLDE